MNDRDDVKQPRDHLPPQDERDGADEVEDPSYPLAEAASDASSVSPETAAEPDKPNRHGVDRLPPSGR